MLTVAGEHGPGTAVFFMDDVARDRMESVTRKDRIISSPCPGTEAVRPTAWRARGGDGARGRSLC